VVQFFRFCLFLMIAHAQTRCPKTKRSRSS
jgi:hypothetical protein